MKQAEAKRSLVKRIGVTGGMGSGKSSLTKIFSSLGYPVWDADSIVREVVQEEAVRAAVVNAFGAEAYSPEGRYDRGWVRQTLVHRPELTPTLELILHPAVALNFEKKCQTAESLDASLWLFYEASLLFESGRHLDFDANILVTAVQETRVSRVIQRSKLPRQQIEILMNRQWSDEKKRRLADFEIINDSDFCQLKKRASDSLHWLQEKFSST